MASQLTIEHCGAFGDGALACAGSAKQKQGDRGLTQRVRSSAFLLKPKRSGLKLCNKQIFAEMKDLCYTCIPPQITIN